MSASWPDHNPDPEQRVLAALRTIDLAQRQRILLLETHLQRVLEAGAAMAAASWGSDLARAFDQAASDAEGVLGK